MLLLQSIAIAFAAFITAAHASPVRTAAGSPADAQFLKEVAGYIKSFDFVGHQITNCDLSDSKLPVTTSNGNLSSPAKGLKLQRVLLGRGTQNYTCADSTKQSIPAANGAMASLFDASCFASRHLSFLHKLPAYILDWSPELVVKVSEMLGKASRSEVLVGHHFFSNRTTPVFELPSSTRFTGYRTEGIPADVTPGIGLTENHYGAVDWLKLSDIPQWTIGGYKAVYRVVTAGGRAPPTCEGRAKNFEIQYAAEYWVYGTK